MPITLQEAKSLLERAEAKATEMEVRVSTAVVDDHGDLLALSRMDRSRAFTPMVAFGKAKASALFGRPSDAYGEHSESPSMRFINELSHNDLVFIPGGLPIERDGEVIGAVGVSGGLASQDAEIAAAALESAGGGTT